MTNLRTNKGRGTRAEREVVNILTNNGWYAVRIPTSGTIKIPDILASKEVYGIMYEYPDNPTFGRSVDWVEMCPYAISVKSTTKDRIHASTWRKDQKGITQFSVNFKIESIAIGRFGPRNIRATLFSKAIKVGMRNNTGRNIYLWAIDPVKYRP